MKAGILAGVGLLLMVPGAVSAAGMPEAADVQGGASAAGGRMPGAAEIDSCFQSAAAHFGIASSLLRAIARQESRFDPDAQGHNPDGSRDIGIMQVNTWWLPRLARYGFKEKHLWEPCTNVFVGAWILAGNIARYGYTWEAVGAYNAGTARTPGARKRRESYAYKVAGQLGLVRRAGRMRDRTDQYR